MAQILWYKANAIVGLNDGDLVAQWNDSSGNNNHALQSVDSLKPIYKVNILNGLPVVRFDGIDNYMDFTTVLSTIRTAFFVINWIGLDNIQYAPLLGHSSLYDWHGADLVNRIFDATYASANIRNGSGYVNGVLTAPTGMGKPFSFKYLSIVALNNVNAGKITNDRNLGGRVWRGDYAEIILYNLPLSDTDRQVVESYLYNKYFVVGIIRPMPCYIR